MTVEQSSVYYPGIELMRFVRKTIVGEIFRTKITTLYKLC